MAARDVAQLIVMRFDVLNKKRIGSWISRNEINEIKIIYLITHDEMNDGFAYAVRRKWLKSDGAGFRLLEFGHNQII